MEAKVFDTFESDHLFEEWVSNHIIMEDYIIIAACKDDCTKNLTWNSRKWFSDLGSRQVEKI